MAMKLRLLFLGSNPLEYVKPAAVDKSWIPVADITCILAPPTIDNRGHYKFEETLNAC